MLFLYLLRWPCGFCIFFYWCGVSYIDSVYFKPSLWPCDESNLMVVYDLFFFFFLEKAMAPHSSTLAWKIPQTEEPGGLQSMGSQRVGHDWVTSLSLFTFMHWRRKWQPTPVFLPRESQGRGSLVGCRLWGRRVGHDWSNLAAAYSFYVFGCSYIRWIC